MTNEIFHPTPRPPHHLQGLLIKVPGHGEVGERLELLDVRLEAIRRYKWSRLCSVRSFPCVQVTILHQIHLKVEAKLKFKKIDIFLLFHSNFSSLLYLILLL